MQCTNKAFFLRYTLLERQNWTVVSTPPGKIQIGLSNENCTTFLLVTHRVAYIIIWEGHWDLRSIGELNCAQNTMWRQSTGCSAKIQLRSVCFRSAFLQSVFLKSVFFKVCFSKVLQCKDQDRVAKHISPRCILKVWQSTGCSAKMWLRSSFLKSVFFTGLTEQWVQWVQRSR